MDNCYIVIPAYNEAKNIRQCINEWYKVVESCGTESRLVVIDDGSNDETYSIMCRMAYSMPQFVPFNKTNGGHGSTILFGYRYALTSGANYIFQTDSDGQTYPSEFYKFWDNRNKYTIIIGERNQRKDGWYRIFVTKILKFMVKLFFGLTIIDANTPFRLMRTDILKKYILLISKDYFLINVFFTVCFINCNENVKFMPITFDKRMGGVNSINMKRIFNIGLQAIKDFSRFRKILKQYQEKKND
jgi:glycosyltransferase involved in cell wall biosynthesis